ncbi:phage portal protein [Clostridium autoethanogenum]|uniref:Phage portal protein n=1 Tax=Clostridium autoethanogenum TaxID=84023 RepID=A0A3M0T2P2_9CLOT|nr:phage tail tube protein [Clostridium autoethanogenum]RMD04906.1 phage portal protein [Clostridium autoethanogenum]
MNKVLDASRVIHGRHGKIMMDGEQQTQVQECTAEVTPDNKEINVLGDDWTRYKSGTKKGSGTMKGYKVTSDTIKRGFKRFEIIASLEDPEAYGYESIRIMNCMASKLQLLNLKANDVIDEEIPFTFEGYELLDAIEAE